MNIESKEIALYILTNPRVLVYSLVITCVSMYRADQLKVVGGICDGTRVEEELRGGGKNERF